MDIEPRYGTPPGAAPTGSAVLGEDRPGGPGVATAPGAATTPAAATAAEQPKRRVLVVEDEVSIADLIVLLLENAGYEVEVATDGQYALMLADSFEPEVIMLDIMLPGMNGFEVTQVLRNAPKYASRFRSTKIIYLTAHRQIIQQRFHALPGTPVSDWIFKPFTTTELLDKVARAFTEVAAARANER